MSSPHLTQRPQRQINLSQRKNWIDVPDALDALAPQFKNNRRLLLVLPVGSKGVPDGLNEHDAYVVVAERAA